MAAAPGVCCYLFVLVCEIEFLAVIVRIRHTFQLGKGLLGQRPHIPVHTRHGCGDLAYRPASVCVVVHTDQIFFFHGKVHHSSYLQFIFLGSGRRLFRAGGLFAVGKLLADRWPGLANTHITALIFVNHGIYPVKHSYTDLINIYVQDEKKKLQVFERGSVYLATKKIGKNNPKAQEIEADNQKRREWNRAVDMALISGVPEPKIMEVKRKEITEPIRESIARRGNRPRLFSRVVTVAVEALEFLIASVLFKKPREVPEQTSVAQTERTEAEHQEHIAENSMAAVKVTKDEKSEPEQPKMTRLASKYSKLFKVNKELEEQNSAIQKKQKQLSAKKKELSEVKGWFKGRKKKELQNEIDELKSQIRDMKDYLPKIVQKIGYRSVQDFLKDFKASQTEYSQYRTAIEKWKKETGKEPVAHGIRVKLAEKKQEIQNEQKNTQHTRSQNKDRGAR